MKKPPRSVKPDLNTYFLAKQSGLFRPGAELILAATLPPQKSSKVKTKGKRK